jgi:hypothetical protein
VDIKNATYTNTIGAVELKTVWTDMEFEPSLDAFYYVRVLQIPTPRWSTYDAKRLGVPPPSSVPATVQERAWSSPIWYTPTAEARKDAPKGQTVADLKGKSAVALDDAQLKQLIVGQTLEVRNTVTGQRFEILYGDDGRRVALDPAIPCEVCDLCHEGHPNLCEEIRFAGHGEDDGGLQEWLAWPERCLVPLPGSLSDADGAMLEPLGVALHAVDLAHLRPGSCVGVFGCGPIGLLVLQAARLAGAARLFATDLAERRRGVAGA